MNGGRRSMSTFSVMTKRLLRCFRGGFPTMGMVSFALARRRDMLERFARGGPGRSRPLRDERSGVPGWFVRYGASEAASGLTTTIGGGGVPLVSGTCLRSGVAGAWGWEELECALPLTAGVGRGFCVLGGGGGGADDDDEFDLLSFFEELESWELFLLS